MKDFKVGDTVELKNGEIVSIDKLSVDSGTRRAKVSDEDGWDIVLYSDILRHADTENKK